MGRPPKLNKDRIQVKIDHEIAVALKDAAKAMDTDRSQLIEDLCLKYLPGYLKAFWRKQSKAKRKAKP